MPAPSEGQVGGLKFYLDSARHDIVFRLGAISPSQRFEVRVSMMVGHCGYPALRKGIPKLPGYGRVLEIYPQPRAFREVCMYPPFRV